MQGGGLNLYPKQDQWLFGVKTVMGPSFPYKRNS